jgi:hypothetical protein
MTTYKCYFMRGNSAPTLETIECDLDGQAINDATSLLHAKPEHHSLEIWKEERLLARVVKGESTQQPERTNGAAPMRA